MATPLIVFAFNRPAKLRQVLAATQHQTIKPSKIIGYVDGFRNQEERVASHKCIDLLHNSGATVRHRSKNFGCAANIMLGIDEVINDHESFLVLEDDVLPSTHWYESMCAMLNRYKDNDHVFGVGSFPSIFRGRLDDHPHDVFATPRFSCWGWGSTAKKFKPYAELWRQYREGNINDLDKISDIAHCDIRHMIIGDYERQLWDAVVAAIMVSKSQVQMVSRHYLTTNIGADKHLSDYANEQLLKNSILTHKIPEIYPETCEIMEKPHRAMIEYVSR